MARLRQTGHRAREMVEGIRQLGFNGPMDERLIQKTFHREEVLDSVHREIVAFLTDLVDATVPHAIAEDGRRQTRNAAILSWVKRLRDLHLQRMTENPLHPSLSLIFTGLLTDYSRIRAHALNLHEAIAEGGQASAA